MKNRRPIAIIIALAAAIAAPLHADPPGPPPGAPGDTMKSLQEIWDKIEGLEAQNAAIQQQNAALLQQLSDLRTFLGAPPSMQMVPVGNAGNAADTSTYGAVDYNYSIGKYEVTNAQYAQFLNAVGATDTHNLYNTSMGSAARGGITRTGTSGSYTYAVKAFMGDKPVNYVNWYDALRFCNWLHNGRPTGAQGNGTTESGAYTLTATNTITLPGSDPTRGANGRNAGARFWLPGESEWYKAAYHQPAVQGGDADNYWLFPTRSNAVPTIATADATGNIDNDSASIANYNQGADWNGQNGNVTTVGSGGSGSASYYGAFDMGGNLCEWNEQIIGGDRGLRGGSLIDGSFGLQSADRDVDSPTSANFSYGFRVAGP